MTYFTLFSLLYLFTGFIIVTAHYFLSLVLREYIDEYWLLCYGEESLDIGLYILIWPILYSSFIFVGLFYIWRESIRKLAEKARKVVDDILSR